MTDVVYAIGQPGGTVVKIGTTRRLRQRLAEIQTGHPARVEVRWTTEGGSALEDHLHGEFRTYRTFGEWFDFGDVDPIPAIEDAVERLRTGRSERMAQMSEGKDELRAVIAEYEAAIPAALKARDEGIRRVAAARDLKQIDVIRITGYSRETVRQVLNPEIRAAMKKAAEERKSAKES